MNAVLPRVLCCALLLLSTQALADSTIIGTVVSADDKHPLEDVLVTATSPNLQGEMVALTNAQGQYRIPQLPPGFYSLRFDKESYRSFARPGITLRLNGTLRVNVELQTESSPENIVTEYQPPTIRSYSTSSGARLSSGDDSPPRAQNKAPRSYESLSSSTAGVALGDPLILRRAVSASGQGAPRASSLGSATSGAVISNGMIQSLSSPAYSAPPPPERTALPPGQPFVDMFFKNYGVNPTIDTEEERFSTFSIDVDRASYALARGYLERGALPDEQSVRVEEFVNTFDYGYPADPAAPFAVHVEGFPSPSRKGYHVVRLGLKAREVSRAQRKPSHLVFVIDVSGSMDMENRLGLVKRALRLLVDELDERDQVSLVVYGSTAHQVLEPTRATNRERILAAIDALRPEGSTNAQAGLELGYSLAAGHLVEGINRIILCSDGVANNGITDADGIWARVRERAAHGITLTTVGFGMGNYNDVLMERLAQVGEGQYAYVDELKEARRLFVESLTGTLQVVAKDVKLQVEFDREAVAFYRLIGYENRMLAKEQFADDRVDAGEVGAGHSVTALYEVKLREPRASFATLRIRYKEPQGGASRLIEKPLPTNVLRTAYARSAPSTRLSWVAAAFAEKLRGSYWARSLSWGQLIAQWERVDGALGERPEVVELGALLRRASALDRRPDRYEPFAPVSTMDFDRLPVIK